MKRWVWILLALVILAGCANENEDLDRAMALRAELLAADGCSFTTTITFDSVGIVGDSWSAGAVYTAASTYSHYSKLRWGYIASKM